MRRFSAAVLAALLAVGLFAPAALAAAPAPTAKAVPRVVFIVGPAGAATSGYRAQARAAATIARRFTPDVVELYSPDATWPTVKQALKGASLVVYMGHGNGWPSRYRNALDPRSQDGFGLNPTAGGGDSSHQYFGEAAIGEQVTLAENAIVLLNHLCYASGNSEPGLPEGTFDQARQRVDNYAAGFIRAGASAVIAEAWSSPSYFVRAILNGGRSIQSAWQTSPSANGHRIAFESKRSAGYIAQMDSETMTSGFTRSIVMKAGLTPKDVLAGARGSASAAVPPELPAVPPEPTLIGTGLTLAAPDINQLPTAGTKGHVDLLYKIDDRKALPKGLQASARWDPIDVAIAPVGPIGEVGATSPTAGAGQPATAPAGAPRAGSSRPAAASRTLSTPPVVVPADTPKLAVPEDGLDLVVPEQLGEVVSPAKVKFGKTAMIIPVTMPTAPGRYRLTIRLHDAEGVAFDALTQALIPPLIVRVTGDFDGAIQAVAKAELTAGTQADLGIRVVNLGRTAWGHAATPAPWDEHAVIPAQAALVIGRWVPLSAEASLPVDPAAQATSAQLPIGLAPGKAVNATLGLKVPTAPGQYLLALDVVTPERGSLAASGADPTLIRVTVLPTPAN